MMNGVGVSDGSDEAKNVAIVTRDPTYFLPSDFIILKVENILFKIPQYPLFKYAHRLRHLFESTARVNSEADPFVVDDDISAKELRHFLRIMFPFVTQYPEELWTERKHPVVSKDEWISVLKISTLWDCMCLRNLAACRLAFRLTGVENIVLGRKYFLPEWVEAGYGMVVQSKIITDEQMEEIGAVESFKLMRMIYENQMGYPSIQTVRQLFQEELCSIGAAGQLYPPISVSIP